MVHQCTSAPMYRCTGALTLLLACMIITKDILKFEYLSINKTEKWENIKKKIQKIITRKIIIIEISGWRHLKEKKLLFLSCEYQSIIPAPKWLNFRIWSQIENEKLYFSPTFKKVK